MDDLVKMRKRIDTLEKEFKYLDLTLIKNRDEIVFLTENLEKKTKQIMEQENKIQEIDVSQMQAEINRLEEDLSELSILLTQKCDEIDVLHDNLGKKTIECIQHEDKIEYMERCLLIRQGNMDGLEEELCQLNEFIAEKCDHIETLLEQLQNATIDLAKQKDTVQHIEKEINHLKNRNMLFEVPTGVSSDEIETTREPVKPDTTSKNNQQDIIKEELSTEDKTTQTDQERTDRQEQK